MRNFRAALLLAFVLAGCGEQPASNDNSRMIACGPSNAEPTQRCMLEVTDASGDLTLTLTLRQPEGGFRRLFWAKGKELTPADGAEVLQTIPLSGGGVEARIDGWRYRIERQGGGLP